MKEPIAFFDHLSKIFKVFAIHLTGSLRDRVTITLTEKLRQYRHDYVLVIEERLLRALSPPMTIRVINIAKEMMPPT
jgi:hypothetical protein